MIFDSKLKVCTIEVKTEQDAIYLKDYLPAFINTVVKYGYNKFDNNYFVWFGYEGYTQKQVKNAYKLVKGEM